MRGIVRHSKGGVFYYKISPGKQNDEYMNILIHMINDTI